MAQLHSIGSRTDATALEFFAGIGLARAGMEEAGIEVIWANDLDASKAQMYANQWGADHFVLADVFDLYVDKIPAADIAWASSPCTDLSLAGNRTGLAGRDSSAFFGFTEVLRQLGSRKPPVVVLENVVGLASSNHGNDLRCAITEFNKMGYVCDVMVIDARRFVPQSRPRLFVIGSLYPINFGNSNLDLRPKSVRWIHEDSELETFMFPLPPAPDLKETGFAQLIDDVGPEDDRWWDIERVEKFLESMSGIQRRRVDEMCKSDEVVARTAYRRTRGGKPVWEMRSADVAGCLRTARGGSSKQAVVLLGHGEVHVRWMTGLEYARLMGAGWYNREGLRDSQVQYGFGDAVAVPVVAWLSRNVLFPLVRNWKKEDQYVNVG